MGRDYDVVVVGAGPGGATAGKLCAEAGLKTLLIERERLPRYKACGGCLSIKTFRLIGVDLRPVIENVVRGVRFTYSMSDPLLISSEEPMGYLVMRDRFDYFLVQQALNQGAELLEQERVTGFAHREGKIEVKLAGGGRLSCEFLIGADGPGSVVARSVSPSLARNGAGGLGLECEVPLEVVRDFPEEERQLVHLDFGRVPSGYGWVFPKKDVLSIGVGGFLREKGGIRPYEYFTGFTGGLGYLRGRELGRVVGHRLPCFYDQTQKVGQGKILLVGDAGYMMDPFTGEGIYYALRSAQLASEAILRSKEEGADPSVLYQKTIEQHIFQELKWASYVSRIIYSLTHLSYRTLKQYPELGQLCLQLLAGRILYQEFVGKVKERISDVLRGRLGEKIRAIFAPARG